MSTRPPFDRRRFLRLSALGGVGLFVPAVLSACGDDDDDAAPGATGSPGVPTTATARALNVQLGWIANVENAGEFVAAEKGYYDGEGLTMTLTPGGHRADRPHHRSVGVGRAPDRGARARRGSPRCAGDGAAGVGVGCGAGRLLVAAARRL